jgi:hypothetical protein
MPHAREIICTTCPRDCYDSCGIAVVRQDAPYRYLDDAYQPHGSPLLPG